MSRRSSSLRVSDVSNRVRNRLPAIIHYYEDEYGDEQRHVVRPPIVTESIVRRRIVTYPDGSEVIRLSGVQS